MLTGILSVVTFLIVIALAVFVTVVAQKQYELSTDNKSGIRVLRSRDRQLDAELDRLERQQREARERARAKHASDAVAFRTGELRLGGDADGKAKVKLAPLSSSAAQKRFGASGGPGLHLTESSSTSSGGGSDGQDSASLAVGKLWSADGVILDDDACLVTRGKNNEGSENSEGNGRVCGGKLTDGLDIIGTRRYTSFGNNDNNSRNADLAWRDAQRRVYVHDYLHARGVDASEQLRVKGGDSDAHNPDGFDTVFASKKDGKNHLRGDTVVDGDVNVAGGVRSGGCASVKGGKSKAHNAAGKRTVFANPNADGRNDIRGDTRVHGDLTTAGRIDASRNGGRFAAADTNVPVPSADETNTFSATALPHAASGENVVRGDTHVSGDAMLHGDLGVKRDATVGRQLKTRSLRARRMRLANDTDKNNVVIEAGRTSDGENEGLSAVNFNGNHDENGENNFDPNKMRWRLGVDQRGDKDRLFVDRFGGGSTWSAVQIKDGKIQLNGELNLCDQNGENCKMLVP